MVLYCGRFILLFTQIIYKKQTQKNRENIFNLTVQDLEKYSGTSYITPAFMLASGHHGLEIKIPQYCTLGSAVP